MSLPHLTSPRPVRALTAQDLANPSPVYVVWELTLQCDSACLHCGSRAGSQRFSELSTSEALELVPQLHALGTREVTLMGGEVYLRSDWLDIVRAIRASGMNCTIVTGGRQVTAELAAAMHDAGLQQLSVSVDGLRDTHDRVRGIPGSHDAALTALRHTRSAGIRTSANTQISALNLHELPELLELLLGHGVSSWQLQLTVPLGRAADYPELLLQPFQMLELMPTLVELKFKAAEAGVWLMPANNVGYFGPCEDDLRATPYGESPHWIGCLAGQATLGIEADGTIKACASLQTESYGAANIRERPLREIWNTSTRIGFTRSRTTEELWGFCRTCYYADVCMGGCSFTAHALFGRPGNNPYCHHLALDLKATGRRERVVRTERAPGRPFDRGRFELVEEVISMLEDDG